MANEIVIVIGFIFTIAAMCKVWNLYAMKQYSESKEKKIELTYGFYVDNLKFVEICIFRKNRALAPHERSAVPLGTDHCPVG